MRFLVGAVLLMCCGQIALATATSVPAVPYDPVNRDFDEPLNNSTWGWSFQVHAPVVVTHFGWRDRNEDGLSHAHSIGIWKVADYYGGSPELVLYPWDVPAGITGELFGPWRRTQLPVPIQLDPGFYSIGGQQNASSADPVEYGFPSAGGDPRISLGLPGLSRAAGFRPLDFYYIPDFGYAGEFGPMFFIESVPEPSSLILATCVGSACILRARSPRKELPR